MNFMGKFKPLGIESCFMNVESGLANHDVISTFSGYVIELVVIHCSIEVALLMDEVIADVGDCICGYLEVRGISRGAVSR